MAKAIGSSSFLRAARGGGGAVSGVRFLLAFGGSMGVRTEVSGSDDVLGFWGLWSFGMFWVFI